MKEKSETRIFISYRHRDGLATAKWVYDELTNRGFSVFMDLEDNSAGAFNTALYKEISNCDVVLAVLPEGALNRCMVSGDWVRNELAFAFQIGKTVIPLMMKGFKFPRVLPKDIDAIRYCHGLEVNYEYPVSFMDKLEAFILSPGNAPPPAPPHKNNTLLIAGVAVVLVLLALLIFRPGAADNIDSIPTPTPTIEITPSPTPTPAPQTQQERIGNTVTNLCNKGFAGPGADPTTYTSLPYTHVQWFNRLENSYYCYDTKERSINGFWPEQAPKVSLLENVDCLYLAVSENYLYYALKEGEQQNLYRAPLDMEAHSIGDPECIVSDILAELNGIAIYNNYIYYWTYTDGLCRCRLDGTNVENLYNNGHPGSTRGFRTFYVDDSSMYFIVRTGGLYKVSVNSGFSVKFTHLLDYRDQDGQVIMAAAGTDKFYYIVRYSDSNERTAPDELWSVNQDGTDAKLMYTLDNAEQEVTVLNAMYSTIYLKVMDDGIAYYYKLLAPDYVPDINPMH